MKTWLRLLAFAAALVGVFTLSLVAARTVRPASAGSPVSAGPTPGHTDQEDDMDHTTASAEPTEGAHGDEHAPAPTADPVRGLAVAEDGYQLEALSAPTRTGEKGELTFRLTGPDGAPVTDYTTSHDKDLHLIVVRSDGSRFRHVHPVTDGTGRWSMPWSWTDAGSYRVFRGAHRGTGSTCGARSPPRETASARPRTTTRRRRHTGDRSRCCPSSAWASIPARRDAATSAPRPNPMPAGSGRTPRWWVAATITTTTNIGQTSPSSTRHPVTGSPETSSAPARAISWKPSTVRPIVANARPGRGRMHQAA